MHAKERIVIFITGATTPTGCRLVRLLVERGEKVRCFTRNADSADLLPNLGEEVAFGDLRDKSSLLAALEGITCVVNIAHISFAPVVIDACRKLNLRRALFISSTRRYSKFPSESAQTVLESEQLIRQSDLYYTILRPSMIYGDDRDNNITQLVRYIQTHTFFPMIGNGRNLVQPLFVWDLTHAISSAIGNHKTLRKEYTLAGSEPIEYELMVRAIAQELGRELRIVHIPYNLAVLAARVYERISSKPKLSVGQVRRFGEDRCFDISSAREDLGFSPKTFEEGLKLKLQGEV